MQVVIDQNDPDESDPTNRIELWGVQDYQDEDGSVRLFWPGYSALGDYETVVEGRVVAGTDESLLGLDTYMDFLTDNTFVQQTVVVKSPDFRLLNMAADEVSEEARETITIIESTDSVDLSSYDFFVTP